MLPTESCPTGSPAPALEERRELQVHFISSSSLLRWSDLGIGPHPQPCSELGQAMGGGEASKCHSSPPTPAPREGAFQPESRFSAGGWGRAEQKPTKVTACLPPPKPQTAKFRQALSGAEAF